MNRDSLSKIWLLWTTLKRYPWFPWKPKLHQETHFWWSFQKTLLELSLRRLTGFLPGGGGALCSLPLVFGAQEKPGWDRVNRGAFKQTSEPSDRLCFRLAAKKQPKQCCRKVTAFIRAVFGPMCRNCRSPSEEQACSQTILKALAPPLLPDEVPCRGNSRSSPSRKALYSCTPFWKAIVSQDGFCLFVPRCCHKHTFIKKYRPWPASGSKKCTHSSLSTHGLELRSLKGVSLSDPPSSRRVVNPCTTCCYFSSPSPRQTIGELKHWLDKTVETEPWRCIY